jgi:hypothetical protein
MVGTRRGERRESDMTEREAFVEGLTRITRQSGAKKTTTPGAMATTPKNVFDLAPTSGEPTRTGKKRTRQSGGDTGGAQPRTRRALAPSPPPDVAITDLTKECLAAVFQHCSPEECRLVLPLVCKQWAEVLREPSDVWKVSF